MPYESVDKLQKVLTESVFQHCSDAKKAAGRALGTIVEIITYYVLKEWDFSQSIVIEKRLPEFGNSEITHNVEFSLHPLKSSKELRMPKAIVPITRAKLAAQDDQARTIFENYDTSKSKQLLSKKGSILLLRNSCTIGTTEDMLLVANLSSFDRDYYYVNLSELHQKPQAIAECKRVGVEEGTKKGPQTIEKAKQGAYVARTVSSLQKIRHTDGQIYGVLPRQDGSFVIKPYDELLDQILNSEDYDLLENFVLTIGVASNHGNWFTSDDPNKELLVLRQSYDWLLFLTDEGISQFVEDLILSPQSKYDLIRVAFMESYAQDKRFNQFTKVSINLEVDEILQQYFRDQLDEIEGWFNIITPTDTELQHLKDELTTISKKNWKHFLWKN